MKASLALSQRQEKACWRPPVQSGSYDRSVRLRPNEQIALDELVASCRWWGEGTREEVAQRQHNLARLSHPLREAMANGEGRVAYKEAAVRALLRACGRERLAFWGWSPSTWCRVLGTTQAQFLQINGYHVERAARQYMMAAAYRLECFTDVRSLGDFDRVALSYKVFGRSRVESALVTVNQVVAGWGYAPSGRVALASALCEAFLLIGSPELHNLTAEFLESIRHNVSVARRAHYYQLGRALAALGFLAGPLSPAGSSADPPGSTEPPYGVAPVWWQWVQQWESTSTLTPYTRQHTRNSLLKVGRWLQTHHPEITTPKQWTRELGAGYVAAVNRMKIGDYTGPDKKNMGRVGQPLSPRAKNTYLGALRVFFRDCQEWDWIPHHFDPGRVFATPRSVKALIGPAPRTIAADIWAKLLWAGMNLTAADLPPAYAARHYPVELLRALATVWLFAGLRSNEIVRLRLGCVRWQSEDLAIPATNETIPKGTVCFLDIPVNKTGTAFTKPVDPVVGEAIAAWERVRPPQPAFLDRKTGELVHFLFAYRARPLPRQYLNGSLIPTLCRKAGIPLKDVRGSITSHRARSTIASQLFNAREPMSLFELQAWLGHRSPATTQHYVDLVATKLAKAYADAGYFARNVRAIEVLIDQDVVKTTAAAAGEPWLYYDLGHGLCTYEFFDQCPHRMACARCDFYGPKNSSQGQLLEAKTNLLHLLQEVPLTEEERAAADGDLAAVERLVAKLTDQLTPSGQTPRQLVQARKFMD